ncbi:MAG: hypothetical protein WD423_00400 [Rhodothermales bacterium]
MHTLKSLRSVLLLIVLIGCGDRTDTQVVLERVPHGGIQPQALVDDDTVHLVYYKGDPAAGDIFYVRRQTSSEEWSTPLRVNSEPGSAVALGTVRGAHLAIGREGRVHVAWMGSQKAIPRGPDGATPMLYTRSDEMGVAFEPQRNVLTFADGLDGGGSVAADRSGTVYVAWHGRGDAEGEAGRRVWVARSDDDGATFERETPAFEEPTGACGCCGMRAYADRDGTLYLLYRAAEDGIHRGMQLLTVPPGEVKPRGARLDEWELEACPMSTASIRQSGERMLGVWENDGQIYVARLDVPVNSEAVPGASGQRKHPVAVGNRRNETLVAWTEGMGWNKAGSLAWHLIDADGRPTDVTGIAPDVPVWSLPTAYADAAGGFVILY